MPAAILILVTHLLGSGHLVRARHLARALAEAGHEVTLASGGMALPAVAGAPYAFVQLPPVKVAGVDFRNLLDETGAPIDENRRAERRMLLAELATRLRPDVVITEHFPFGRRQLAQEFLGLIAAARAANPKALVLSSVRDVLVTPRPDRIAEAHARLTLHFDGVLVHGDRAFLPLDASWPVSAELSGRLHYTGYIAPSASRARPSDPAAAAPGPAGLPRPACRGSESEILVSGGGSGAALPLFRLCLDAARRFVPGRLWRILVGLGASETDFAELGAAAPGHVLVEWSRPDFPALLGACALSISQAGYNTVLDLVQAGRPAIVVPFDEGGETEQAIRAQAMERAGLARCLQLSGPEPLTPATLASHVAAQLLADSPPRLSIDRDGATEAGTIIARLLAERVTDSPAARGR